MKWIKKNKLNILITFILLGCFFLGWFWGDIFKPADSIEKYKIKQALTTDKKESNLNKIQYIYDYVINNHIYREDLDTQEMWENAFKGLVSGVDGGYTQYVPPVQETEVQQQISGKYVGFGILLDKTKDGKIYIKRIDDNSKADEQGLANGDVLLVINDIDVSKSSMEEVVSIMQKENKIHISVQRENDKIIETTLEKETIIPPDLAHYKLVDTDIHYIKIDSFNDKTVEDVKNIINKHFQKDNNGSIIFDVRNNYGGTLDSYEEIIDIFVNKNTTLYTKRSLEDKEVIKSKKEQEVKFDNYIVLVNQNTASAAELFASNIKDILGGKVVGLKTYGKGVIQSVYNLDDGSYLYITDKEYLTSKGEPVQNKGITPDYEIEDYIKQETKAIDLLKQF